MSDSSSSPPPAPSSPTPSPSPRPAGPTGADPRPGGGGPGGPGAPARPFVLHRGAGGGPDVGLDLASRRKVLIAGAFAAPAALFGLYLMLGPGGGLRTQPALPVLPRAVERVTLGLSRAEVEALAMPGTVTDARAYFRQELRGTDPIEVEAKLAFDGAGRLSSFDADQRLGARGTRLDGGDLTRLIARKAALQTLDDVRSTLGEGLLVRLTLDSSGRTDVLRWTAEDNRTHLDVTVRGTKVLSVELD